jgi:hypothetical protein
MVRLARRVIATLGLLMGLPLGAVAGELVLTNGQRVTADLLNDTLLVSTGTDLVEIDPTQVVRLTPREIRLRDGRVLSATVVGGRIRARTPLGELAVKIDDIESFQIAPPAVAPPTAATPTPAPASTPPAPAPVTPAPAPAAPAAAAPAPAAAAPAPVTAAPAAVASAPAPAPAERPEGPAQVADGARKVGQGTRDTAVGVGQTFSDAADAAHDGFKALGLRIWEAMRAVGETFRDAFTGRPGS